MNRSIMLVSRRVRWGVLVLAALAALAVGVGTAFATHDEVATASGCNEQPLGEGGLTVRWTSSFNDDFYGTGTATRSGSFLVGDDMDVLEVGVQWSIHDAAGVATGDPSSLTDVALRGDGFTPGGVEGRFVNGNAAHGGVSEANKNWAIEECGIDPDSGSYRVGTFYFQFTKLHKPGKRPNAKGNAELNVNIDAEDLGAARLGTNLHVATGPDNG